MAEDAVWAYAAARRFGPITTQRWLRHTQPDRDALLRLTERLRLGENQFRDVLDALEDIAARRNTTLAALVVMSPLATVLDGGRGRNQTLRALRDALRRLRYPQLTTTETALASLAKRLRLPAGVRLEFPENLEGDQVSITICATSAAELRDRAAAVAAIAGRPEIEEMFRLLEGN